MSYLLPKSVQRVIDHFARLPGIGQKTAERLTFYLLKDKSLSLENFGQSIGLLTQNLNFCERCCNLTEKEQCIICSNSKRDLSIICIVEEVLDIVALEKMAEYKGVYHVLHGVISPVNGVGPQDLTIEKLVARVENDQPQEIILATNPTMEGEATALYISKKLKPYNIKITRLARGLPSGGDIEYADRLTLSNSLLGRQEF